jgi:hypothetical protein
MRLTTGGAVSFIDPASRNTEFDTPALIHDYRRKSEHCDALRTEIGEFVLSILSQKHRSAEQP